MSGDSTADRDARRPDRCGLFCDADPDPDVEFVDEWGVTNRVCRECYDRVCGRCRGEIRDAYKRKGLCQDCRDEISLWSGDADRGIQKDSDTEQATLLTDGGRERTYVAPGGSLFSAEEENRLIRLALNDAWGFEYHAPTEHELDWWGIFWNTMERTEGDRVVTGQVTIGDYAAPAVRKRG